LSLRVLIDQNIPVEVAVWLRLRRPHWRIDHVSEVALWGSSDLAIFAWAQERAAVVFTFDEDFADARMFPAGTHAGVVRFRVWPTTVERTIEAMTRLLGAVAETDLAGSLTIVDKRTIRIRREVRRA